MADFPLVIQSWPPAPIAKRWSDISFYERRKRRQEPRAQPQGVPQQLQQNQMELQTTITRYSGPFDIEIPVVMDFDYILGMKGRRNKYGEQIEPDDMPEIIINSVTHISGGKPLELTKAEQEQIEAECWEQIKETN